MKKLIDMSGARHATTWLWIFLALICMVSCGAGNNDTRAAEPSEQETEMPRKELKRVMKAFAEGNAQEVASLCIYPIERPYPIKNITDSAAMVVYFPMIADKELRNTMKAGDIAKWWNGGWRGWIFGDPALLSYDDGIYDISYLSQSEKALRDSLAKVEIESLAPAMRGNWVPVACMLDSVGGVVYRIDRDGNGKADDDGIYRLAFYGNKMTLNGMPDGVYTGKMASEGSMQVPVYTFEDSKGDSYVYLGTSQPDEPNMTITHSGKVKDIYVVPVYWNDFLKVHH